MVIPCSFYNGYPVLSLLFQIFRKEALELVERDHVILAAVVEIRMGSAGDSQKFLVAGVLAVLYHVGIGILAEIEGVCLVAVHDENRGPDLIRIFKDRLVHEGLAPDDIPSAVGV